MQSATTYSVLFSHILVPLYPYIHIYNEGATSPHDHLTSAGEQFLKCWPLSPSHGLQQYRVQYSYYGTKLQSTVLTVEILAFAPPLVLALFCSVRSDDATHTAGPGLISTWYSTKYLHTMVICIRTARSTYRTFTDTGLFLVPFMNHDPHSTGCTAHSTMA